MTKGVTVIIDGLQHGVEAEAITFTAPGVYHHHNGKHYILYDEITEGEKGITKNTIKIASNKIDMIKIGVHTTQMVFDLNETTDVCYQTPYGNLLLRIHTTGIQVVENLDEIQVKLEYTLSTEDNHLSDNLISILICSKSK